MKTVPNPTDAGESTRTSIGWQTGVGDEGPWIGLRRKAGDGTVTPLERTYPEDVSHPLIALGYLLDDAVMYVGDPEDTASAIEPIPGAVLAQLGQPLYTARLTLRAGDVLNPVEGPKWLILHAVDEETWCPVTEVVACEAVHLDRDDDGESCVVLVSEAYGIGFAHLPADEFVTVRIPAGDA